MSHRQLLLLIFLSRWPTLPEPLGTIRDPRLHKPAFKPTTMHLLDARLGSTAVTEADRDDAFGLSIEQYGVLDSAELEALLAYVSDDEFGHALLLVLVLLQILGCEQVFEDDNFVPLIHSGGNDGDVVFIPIVEASGQC
jgi:hypothetical protein